MIGNQRHLQRVVIVLSAVLAVAGGANLWRGWETRQPAQKGQVSLMNLLDEDAGEFTRVGEPWQFEFPRDHGAHRQYQTESWYFVGNLYTTDGRQFGFQLTFFRLALSPQRNSKRASAWAAKELYRAHFALTDVAAGRLYAAERYSRAALNLSGASAKPVRIWLDDWSLTLTENNSYRLNAKEGKHKLSLFLQELKAKVLIGGRAGEDTGFGGTIYAYFCPRLEVRGEIQLHGQNFRVRGLAWFDHAWGLVPIPEGQVVWDRFLLQLDDGSELLALSLRRRDGSGTPRHTVLTMAADGVQKSYSRDEADIQVLDHWASPIDGARYPSAWRLRIPAKGVTLNIYPLTADQELDLSTRYWAGAVKTTGHSNGNQVTGKGFAELTGYGPK